MLVQCPSCQTTYKVSDDVLSGDAPAFRCSRCKHTFELEANDDSKPTSEPVKFAAAPDAQPIADDELRLPFAPSPEAHPTAPEPENSIERSSKSGAPVAAADDDHVPFVMSAKQQDTEKPFIFPDASTEAAEFDSPEDFTNDDLFRKLEFHDPNENPNNITPISPYLDQRASVKPFLTLLGFLVIGFCLFAAMSYARPDTPLSVIKNIPLIGTTVLQNNHLKQGILIKSLSTASETIQGNREVFLISGVVLNQNPVVLREIQVTGKTYNGVGKQLERQTIWVGNTLSPKIIRGMTLEDIPQLQELKPLKSFEVPPGDSVPFTIVFLKSGKNTKEFTCEVTSATGKV